MDAGGSAGPRPYLFLLFSEISMLKFCKFCWFSSLSSKYANMSSSAIGGSAVTSRSRSCGDWWCPWMVWCDQSIGSAVVSRVRSGP